MAAATHGSMASFESAASPDTTTIQVNGEPRPCPAGRHLDEVLTSLGYRPQLVVVEYNGAILPRPRWSEQLVQAGDTLEVVTIVGGGS